MTPTICFGHFAPYALPVDVHVDGERVVSDLAFGRVADPVPVESGPVSVVVVSEGEVLVESDLAVGDGEAVVLVTGPDAWIAAAADAEPVDLGRARVRFVNLVRDDAPVDVAVRDGATLFEGLEHGDVSEFRTVKADPYEFEVRSTDGPPSVATIGPEELDGRTSHTVVLYARRSDAAPAARVIRSENREAAESTGEVAESS